MSRESIYLDYPSATPMRAEVREVMLSYLEGQPPNANAAHRAGRRARQAIGAAREQVATWLEVEAEEIVFTSGGTESNTLAILGRALAVPEKKRMVTTTLEHPSVRAALARLEADGWEVVRVPGDAAGGGRIDPDQVAEALDAGTALVALHLGNHDIGTIQPVREIAARAQEYGVPVFVDATFSAGWVDVRPEAWGIDLLSLAPYRFFGPQGAGVLWRKKSCRMKPLFSGGDQESGLRSGSRNVAAIAGAGEAARLAMREGESWQAHTRQQSIALLRQLRDRITGIHCFGPEPGEKRMPHHLSLAFDRVEGEALMLNLDVGGVAVTAGAGCLPAQEKVSPVLTTLGVDGRLALGMILIGPGPETTDAQIDEAVRRIVKGVHRIREMTP